MICHWVAMDHMIVLLLNINFTHELPSVPSSMIVPIRSGAIYHYFRSVKASDAKWNTGTKVQVCLCARVM